MQQVRLWEITADRKLSEIPARYASLEQWIEDWLANDISVLDPDLLVIGRQVRTSFGGAVDLLSMDGKGSWKDNVFVERLWKSVKYEEVYLRAYESVPEARTGLGRYFEFYNAGRPNSSLGGMTPDQFFDRAPAESAAA